MAFHLPTDKRFFELIKNTRHPIFQQNIREWEKWRRTYDGGERFLDDFLRKFSKRESKEAFLDRKEITPIAGYAKIAINRIRNGIFQRMGDIIRPGGSKKYNESVNGEKGGVDRRGSKMNFFMGQLVLTDLLVMGRFGVFVDSPPNVAGTTRADTIGAKPYLYGYRVEDILSWQSSLPEDPNEFQALLLRDVDLSIDQLTHLPRHKVLRFRWVFINPDTGKVNTQFLSSDGKPDGPLVELELTRIPFHVFDIGGSLMKDIFRHQIALLNIDSANVNYNILSNFPFYQEKRPKHGQGRHQKAAANADGTATAGGQGANEETIELGNMVARTYDDEPGSFTAPPSEPLLSSLQVREQLVNDIDRLSLLAVAAVQGDLLSSNEGLESGLAFIANVLETGERRIAEFWAIYEERVPSARKIATVHYPDRYSLKTDAQRIEDATNLGKLMFSIPGRTNKKEIAKLVMNSLLAGKVNAEKMELLLTEIEESPYCTSDPDTVEMAVDKGLVSNKTASMSLGYKEDEHIQAQIDRAERIALTQIAQQSGEGGMINPAARGVPDLSTSPQQDAADEKELSREMDTQPTPEKRVRGEQK